jgi:hypothetical protein
MDGHLNVSAREDLRYLIKVAETGMRNSLDDFDGVGLRPEGIM